MTDPGEFSRLTRLIPYLHVSSEAVPVGVGDDAAVIRIGGTDVVVCVDTVVEGVHFRRDLSLPADVGWKAIAVNVSDVAAMGGVPRAAVVALNRPADLSEDDLEDFYAGMDEAASAYDLAIVGGDTVTAGEWAVAVTVVGDLDGRPAVRRDGARPGQAVILAGQIGAAASALHADAEGGVPDDRHLQAHRRPRALPRTGQALARSGATAMIDISDGLGADARHVGEASTVALQLDQKAVESVVADGVLATVGEGWLDLALGGGEDFALLATVASDRVEAAVAAVAEAGETEAAVIGQVLAGQPDGEAAVWLVGADDRRRIDHLGYDHG